MYPPAQTNEKDEAGLYQRSSSNAETNAIKCKPSAYINNQIKATSFVQTNS